MSKPLTTHQYLEHDKSKAICSHCQKIVTTTFQYRDVPFSDGLGVAKNILVGVCDECHVFASIPAQSSASIKEQHDNIVATIKNTVE